MCVSLVHTSMSPESSTSCYIGVSEMGDPEACMFFRGTAGTTVDDPLWAADQGRPGMLQLLFNILRFIYTLSILNRCKGREGGRERR